jgi:DNA-binding MarR family transcriptional regulator
MTMFMPFRVSEMVALCNKTYPDLVSRKDSLDDIAPEGLMLPVPGVDYGALDGLLGYALRRAQNALYLDFYRATAAWGISPQRFAALVLIARNPGLRQGLLGQAMGLHRSGALRLTDWLTAQGYAERRDAPGDARAWGLHLTAAGKRLLVKLEAAVAPHDRKLLEALGDQGPALKAALERLAWVATAQSTIPDDKPRRHKP